ncbi:hypothetical protein Moror_13390, partial [Moniliophthora roreri MCA 2997]
FSTNSDNELMETDIPTPALKNDSPPPLHRPPNPLPTTPFFILNLLLILTLSQRLSTPSEGSPVSTPLSMDPTVRFYLETKDIAVVAERGEDEENNPLQSLHQSALEIPDNP